MTIIMQNVHAIHDLPHAIAAIYSKVHPAFHDLLAYIEAGWVHLPTLQARLTRLTEERDALIDYTREGMEGAQEAWAAWNEKHDTELESLHDLLDAAGALKEERRRQRSAM